MSGREATAATMGSTLSPMSLREAWGYTPREVERIRRLVVAHRREILRQWHEFFDA